LNKKILRKETGRRRNENQQPTASRGNQQQKTNENENEKKKKEKKGKMSNAATTLQSLSWDKQLRPRHSCVVNW
jgi:hypothetical protein